MQSTDKKEANIHLENREEFTFVAKFCSLYLKAAPESGHWEICSSIMKGNILQFTCKTCTVVGLKPFVLYSGFWKGSGISLGD
jgi:hypothetical protein